MILYESDKSRELALSDVQKSIEQSVNSERVALFEIEQLKKMGIASITQLPHEHIFSLITRSRGECIVAKSRGLQRAKSPHDK